MRVFVNGNYVAESRYIYHQWGAPKLRYVLLPGDATYDFKDYLRTGVANQLPPYMVRTSYLWTASDAASDFEHDAEEIASSLLVGRETKRIYLGELGASATRDAIVGAFDAGASTVSYMVLAAQQHYADTGAFPELLAIYHLFGDPALRVK